MLRRPFARNGKDTQIAHAKLHEIAVTCLTVTDRRSWFGPGRIRTYDQGIHFAPAFPPGVDYLFTRARRGASCVWVRDAHACHQGHSSPQVVSAPSAGVPAARLRVAMGCYAEGFPEFIPSTSRVSTRRHLVDESPALTAVLQAQRPGL